MMKNETLLNPPDPFPWNVFTVCLKLKIKETGKPVNVTLRNGKVVPVFYGRERDDDTEDCFYCSDRTILCNEWQNDGSSMTSRDFDIVEF